MLIIRLLNSKALTARISTVSKSSLSGLSLFLFFETNRMLDGGTTFWTYSSQFCLRGAPGPVIALKLFPFKPNHKRTLRKINSNVVVLL